jgi:hypothetical protein
MTGTPWPVNTDRSSAEPTSDGSVSAQAAAAASATTTAGSASSGTSPVASGGDSRAVVPPRLAAAAGEASTGTVCVPDVDYIPLFSLFALLGSQLTNDEVSAIADELATESKPESAEAIRGAITEVAHHQPTDADVNRVRARLAGGGWPLEKPTITHWPNP